MNSLTYRTVEAKSMTDKLTGLSNRRNFDVMVERLVASCASSNIPVSVMMVDIDNFKEYNDTHGHQEGDKMLESIGSAVKSLLGEQCCAFRYGGEELAAIIPKAKPAQAFEIAEKLRKGIGEKCKITVSIGLATCLNSSCPPRKMVSEADSCLYKAKSAGKNRTHSSVIIDKSMNPIDVQAASAVGKS
jgi:diguanylate cyclase (GGDEF)-like protein